ncbi:MAG: hypothetical protein V5A68_02080 [Candidatus Thermoplasmatota archaeon]
MKKKILAIIFALIMILSIALAYNIFHSSNEKENEIETYYEKNTDDFLEDLNESFLDQDDEVEIGEII